VAFACAGCGKTLRMPPGSGGKKGKCPACGEVFEIPVETPARDGAHPRPSASRPAPVAGLTPLEDLGLTPLDDSFDPLGGGGLSEVGVTSGSAPRDDPFASLNIPNPFADPLAGGTSAAGGLAANPYQSPGLFGAGKKSRSRGDFSYVDVLSCTWNTFWDNWTSCLLLSLALMGLYLGLTIVVGAVQFGLGLLVRQLPPVPGMIVGLVILVAVLVLMVIVGFIVQAGLIRIFVNMVKGKAYSIGGLLQEAGYAGSLFGAAILQFLMGMGLGMLLALPIVGLMILTKSPAVAFLGQLAGIALNVLINILLLLTPYLIVDQDRGVLDAISESASVMKGNILVTLGLLLTVALGLVAFVLVTLGLGLLLAGPFMLVLLAVIYARATGQRTAF
jgi:phage FluMu protein Com